MNFLASLHRVSTKRLNAQGAGADSVFGVCDVPKGHPRRPFPPQGCVTPECLSVRLSGPRQKVSPREIADSTRRSLRQPPLLGLRPSRRAARPAWNFNRQSAIADRQSSPILVAATEPRCATRLSVESVRRLEEGRQRRRHAKGWAKKGGRHAHRRTNRLGCSRRYRKNRKRSVCPRFSPGFPTGTITAPQHLELSVTQERIHTGRFPKNFTIEISVETSDTLNLRRLQEGGREAAAGSHSQCSSDCGFFLGGGIFRSIAAGMRKAEPQ